MGAISCATTTKHSCKVSKAAFLSVVNSPFQKRRRERRTYQLES